MTNFLTIFKLKYDIIKWHQKLKSYKWKKYAEYEFDALITCINVQLNCT